MIMAVCVVAALTTPSASADSVIGSRGSEAGQYTNPFGVAEDAALERIYVADRENYRIDVFSTSGEFIFAFGWRVNASNPEEKLQTCTTDTGCLRGVPGGNPGQFSYSQNHLAVDPVSHDIYSEAPDSDRVQRFDSSGKFVLAFGGSGTIEEEGKFDTLRGVAVGPGGVVYVLDMEGEGKKKRLQRLTSSGVPSSPQCALASTQGQGVMDLAVDSGGDFYVATNGPEGTVQKYDSNCNPLFALHGPSYNITALAIGPSDNLLLADNTEQSNQSGIFEYSADGELLRVFYTAGLLDGRIEDMAISSSGTSLFASQSGTGVVEATVPPPGPLLVPGSVKPCPVGNVKATLCATFNPEGKPSKARFEYISKADYEAAGNDFGAGTEITPFSAETPPNFNTETVKATNTCVVPTESSCLAPETTYVFRAVAVNSEGEVRSEPAEFTTLAPHEVLALWSIGVGTDTVRISAEANPLGVPVSGHFEVIAEGADYQANGFQNATDYPAFPQAIDFGGGETPLVRSLQLTGLVAGTTYHYRLVLEDPYFAPVVASGRSFITLRSPGGAEAGCANQAYRTGTSASLPDCRAYEIVSPLDKSNGDVFTRINGTGYSTNLDQSSLTGSAFAFTSYKAFADPESSPYTNQYLAKRTERGEPGEGWSTENLSPPREGQFRTELENQFQAFDSELERSWMLQEGEPQLDPCAPAGVAGLYRRDSGGSFAPLSCSSEGEIEVGKMPEFQGASDDGSKAIFRVPAKLTGEASDALVNEGGGAKPAVQLYESTPEGLRLVSALPSGEASAMLHNSAGTAFSLETTFNHNREGSILGALSADGTRVFWTAGTGSGTIYLRLNSDQAQSKVKAGVCTQPTRACTIPVSGTVAPENAYFQMGSRDGTKALFTFTDGPLAGNLYRFDSEAQPPVSTLVSEGVIENILGASKDLSRVYFASTAADPARQAEGAVPGEPNVYLWVEGTTRFVATLSTPKTAAPNSDTANRYGAPFAKRPVERTSRVAPDGQSLAFMSNSPALAMETAGYDNTDAVNGQDDFEVYLYNAEAEGGAGVLRCVSCNPSGARPVGASIGEGTDGSPDTYAAASIPRYQTQLHQGRYLTDDGRRVFFNSFEPLSLVDTNGKADVYQWEAAGTGSCSTESPTYVEASEGCLRLISSGKSTAASQFLDADSDGSDAFFTTVERLLPQDPGLVDVYDARVQGGFPPLPAPPAACEGEACQGPFSPPTDPTPASSSFHGAGNVPEGKVKNKKCPKGKVRQRKRCVKKHPKRAHHNRRNHR
jgi:hypothetical protein